MVKSIFFINLFRTVATDWKLIANNCFPFLVALRNFKLIANNCYTFLVALQLPWQLVYNYSSADTVRVPQIMPKIINCISISLKSFFGILAQELRVGKLIYSQFCTSSSRGVWPTISGPRSQPHKLYNVIFQQLAAAAAPPIHVWLTQCTHKPATVNGNVLAAFSPCEEYAKK